MAVNNSVKNNKTANKAHIENKIIKYQKINISLFPYPQLQLLRKIRTYINRRIIIIILIKPNINPDPKING
jgi:hypothetical protein